MLSRLKDTFSDFFCLNRKYLVYNILSRNLKLRYRRSFLGYFWTLLVPLTTAAIYYFVFNVLHKIGDDSYALLVVVGILAWGAFAGTINEGINSLSSNFSLLSQINVPLHLFPFCSAVTQFVVYFFSLPVILVFMIWFKAPFTSALFWLPYYILLLFIISYSISFLVAVGFIYIRDIKQVMSHIVHVWFYLTPVIYRGNRLQNSFSLVSYINPVGKIFPALQSIILNGEQPTRGQIVIPAIWAFLFLCLALFAKARVSKVAIENI